MHIGLEGFLHGSIQGRGLPGYGKFLKEILQSGVLKQSLVFIIEVSQIAVLYKMGRNREIKYPLVIQAIKSLIPSLSILSVVLCIRLHKHQVLKQTVYITDFIGNVVYIRYFPKDLCKFRGHGKWHGLVLVHIKNHLHGCPDFLQRRLSIPNLTAQLLCQGNPLQKPEPHRHAVL